MPRLRPIPKKQDAVEEEPKLFESAPEKDPAFEAKEPEVKEVKEPEKEDPSLALQKQLEELKKSEELQRTQRDQLLRERDEAVKRANDRAVEVSKFQKEAIQSQYDNISTALTAAQEAAESAKRDMKVAISNADPDLQAEAFERLATARANISKLEDGKYELEARFKAESAAAKVAPKQEPQQDPLGLDKSNLPDAAKTYLRAHPELITDPRKNARLQAWHWDAIDAGKEAFSKDYFDFIDEKRQPKVEEKTEIKAEPERTNIVSAPVSREVPSGGAQRQNGKITLSPEQKEFAKIAGVTETEYAKQLIRMNEEKSRGNYTGGQ